MRPETLLDACSTPGSGAGADTGTVRALIADDAASMRLLLRAFLEEEGVEVEEAATGAAVLSRLRAITAPPVDVVVLDQRMPDLSGLEVARRIAAGEHPPRLVLFTGHMSPALEREAHELGVVAVQKTELDRLVALVCEPVRAAGRGRA